MLQRIRAKTQGWLAWALIAILASVFVLWGISGELMSKPGDESVAKVANEDITANELQTAYDRLAQQSQMAQVMAGISSPIINEERLRKQALDSVIMEHVLTHAASVQGFFVTPNQVDGILVQLPQFQVNGEFSPQLYERIIRQMNFTPQAFRDTVLKEMLISQAQSTFRDSVFLLPYQLNEAIELVNQTRDIQYAILKSDTFTDQLHLTDADLEAYYNGHQSEFMTDESVKIAYVELSQSDVAEKIKQTENPSADQLRTYYNEHLAQFSSPELRAAKHILIAVKPDASQTEQEAAHEKAEKVLAALKSGASFSELAKKDSDDPGSAVMGGELGSFGRGEMVPEFDKAVFEAKAGDLVGPVKTDFGYHIILVEKIQSATVKPFEEVQATLMHQWLAEKTADAFDKEIGEIDQMAFESADSLDKVSESFHLPLKTMTVLSELDKNTDLGKNPQIHQAAFSDDVLQARRNSEILRIAPDKVLVLRVVEHQAATLKPFESVKNDLTQVVRERQGALLARDKANKILEAYTRGEDLHELSQKEGITWETAKGVNRQNTQQLPVELLKLTFSSPPQDKPAMTGVEIGNKGTALVLLEAVHPGIIDPHFAQAMNAEFSDSLSQFKGTRDFNLYVAQAKEEAKIKTPE